MTTRMSLREDLIAIFEKNRQFFTKGPSRDLNWDKVIIGGLCLARIEYVIILHAAGEEGLAARWLDEVDWLIAEGTKRVMDDPDRDWIDLDRVYVRLAAKLAGLLHDRGIDRASTTPYDAFSRYLTLAPTPEDRDCVWLMQGLCALLEGRSDQYESLLPELRRKPHRDLVRERELLSTIGRLFTGTDDEGLWALYSEVL